MKEDKKGITLVSLVVTITVLIILASIATYNGANVIKQSKLNKFTTEMKIMQTEVNNLYDRYSNGEIDVLNIGKELDSEANNVFTGGASGITDSSGYRYYDRETIKGLGIENVEEEFYVNVSKRSVISRLGIEYEGKKYYTLAQLPNGLYNVEYENKNTGKPTFKLSCDNWTDGRSNIKIIDIEYSEGYIEKWEVKYKLEGQENWNTSEDFSFFVDTPGMYTVKIVNRDVESEEKQVEVVVANAPKLAKGMIPVKYNTSSRNWVICSKNDPEWYSYTKEDKKWANIMLCDGKYDESTAIGTEVAEEDLGSMFVWVPRYAYKITEGYHSSAGSLDVKFIDGTNYRYYDDKGNLKEAKNGNEEGVITEDGYTDYVVHPAFTDGNKYNSFDNGEWRQEIEGIWVAKFKAGIYTTNKDTNIKIQNNTTANSLYYPIFKGRKFGYNYVSVSQCYDISQSLDDNGNPYGINNLANSHLMKNSEWGAVAYLSISQYGYSEGSSNKEKAKNNLSIVDFNNVTASPVTNPNNTGKITAITGYSAVSGKETQNVMTYTGENNLKDAISGTNGISYAWNNCDNNLDEGNGTLSSTTGNVYGVYDMGGCLANYTATYVNSGTSNLVIYGKSFVTGKSDYLSTAYPYNPVLTDYKDFNSGYNGTGWNKIFGDAIWETSSGTGDKKAWFSQTLEDDIADYEPFFPRGGNWTGTSTCGLCGSYDDIGHSDYNYGFHSILVVE